MFEISDDTILIVTKPNFFIKFFAYFLLPLGSLLLLLIIWSRIRGESNDVQIIMSCLTCLVFGIFSATRLKTASFKFDKAARTVTVIWGKSEKRLNFDEIKSLDGNTYRNSVILGMSLTNGQYFRLYVFPKNEMSKSDGGKLLNALSENLSVERKLDSNGDYQPTNIMTFQYFIAANAEFAANLAENTKNLLIDSFSLRALRLCV